MSDGSAGELVDAVGSYAARRVAEWLAELSDAERAAAHELILQTLEWRRSHSDQRKGCTYTP